MVWFGLAARLHVRLIYLRKHLIVNWTPAVVFKTHVPPIVRILLWLIKVHIDSLLSRLFFHLHVISGCEGIYINYSPVHKDLVEDKWREF
jgi:hypothetical protein